MVDFEVKLETDFTQNRLFQRLYPFATDDRGKPIAHKFTLDDLINRYNNVCAITASGKVTSLNDQTALESYKLALMKSLNHHIAINYYEESASKPKIEPSPSNNWRKKLYSGFMNVLYGVLLLIGLVQDGLGSFLYGQSLLSAIPGISRFTLLTASIAFGVLNTLLLCSFKANTLKDDLGIMDLKTTSNSLHKSHDDQIEETNKTNSLLSNAAIFTKIDQAYYQKLSGVALLFNENIRKKNPIFKNYHEPFDKKLFRWTMTLFGACMVVSSGYFMAKSLLTTIAAPLLATPLAGILIGVSILSSLTFYLAQAHALLSIVNPDFQRFKTVKKKLEEFKGKTAEDFEHIKTIQSELIEQITATKLIPQLKTRILELEALNNDNQKQIHELKNAKNEANELKQQVSKLKEENYYLTRRITRNKESTLLNQLKVIRQPHALIQPVDETYRVSSNKSTLFNTPLPLYTIEEESNLSPKSQNPLVEEKSYSPHLH